MTWDPRKLAQLKLLRPLYFFSSRTGQHATPAQLQQHYVRCPQGAKPLAVLYLLDRAFCELQSDVHHSFLARSVVRITFCRRRRMPRCWSSASP